MLRRHGLEVQPLPFNKGRPEMGSLQRSGSLGVSAPGLDDGHVGHQVIKLPVALENRELCPHSSDSVWVVSVACPQRCFPLPAPAEACMVSLPGTPWLPSYRQNRASPLPHAKADPHKVPGNKNMHKGRTALCWHITCTCTQEGVLAADMLLCRPRS